MSSEQERGSLVPLILLSRSISERKISGPLQECRTNTRMCRAAMRAGTNRIFIMLRGVPEETFILFCVNRTICPERSATGSLFCYLFSDRRIGNTVERTGRTTISWMDGRQKRAPRNRPTVGKKSRLSIGGDKNQSLRQRRFQVFQAVYHGRFFFLPAEKTT